MRRRVISDGRSSRGYSFYNWRRRMEDYLSSYTPYYKVYGENTNGEKVNEVKEDKEKTPVLQVKAVDYKIEANAVAHHTDSYELTESHEESPGKVVPAQLVVRRGQPFNISVTMDRAYETGKDDIKLVFEMGDKPRASKGNLVKFDVSAEDKPKEWQAKVTGTNGNVVDLQINSPPDGIIGMWELNIETIRRENQKEKIYRYIHSQPIYMIFNPWCKDDAVYMDDQKLLDEYILNDTGKIYSGNYKQIGSKPWNFGQFEDFVLKCAFWLLDNKGNMSYKNRGDPVKMCRRLSALVNDCDDDGVLTGNWSGDYSGGIPPTKWVGSVKILEQYWKTKKPVQYGQCWVFSGVTTTVCRALGIPCRSVTNFASAHDSDGSITIDQYWNKDGSPKEELNDDSVWNFHVWNEGWMARPDLPSGCGGWQAFDATPQETSEGIYCAGPASLNALKQGMCNLPYDGPFIFAEVNADKVHWVEKVPGTDDWKQIIQREVVGKNISTKLPNGIARNVTSAWQRFRDPDREDVTNQYKFAEGSHEERAAVWRAASASTKPEVYDQGAEDVTFSLVDKDEIMIGSPFDVEVKVKNTSKEKRSVSLRLTASVVFYTGVVKCKLKTDSFSFVLNGGNSKDVKLHITPDEYLGKLVDQAAMKMNVLGEVEETLQVFAASDDFRLRRPDVEIEVKGKAKVGQEMECSAFFVNPLPKVTLTKCEFTIEGPMLQKPIDIACPDIPSGKEARINFKLTPKKSGDRQIMASFDCKEIPDITGYVHVIVEKK